MKKRYAILSAGLLSCLAYVLVNLLTDGVFLDTRVPPGRAHRAALAIRDDVTPFQKWGTKTFTWRYLNRYYDTAWYFTQSRKGGQEEAFLARLDDALARYPHVDLFLLSHDNRFIDWVRKLPAEDRQGLRLVYNTGCHNAPQGQAWLRAGADAYIGHPGKSASPPFYVYFMRRWCRGEPVQTALETSNRLAMRSFRLAQTFTLGHFNAAKLEKQSKASYVGDGDTRVEDGEE